MITASHLTIQPFTLGEYVYAHEASYTESGAQSLDLHIQAKNANLRRAEAGLNLSGCFSLNHAKLIPSGYRSCVYEDHDKGSRMRANFNGQSGNFTAHGLEPHHSLLAAGVGLTALLGGDLVSLGLIYDCKFGTRYWDNHLNLHLGFGF